VSDPGAELVDVVDTDGHPVCQVARREVRARRLPHRSVYVLVFNAAGELFVHLRTPTKDVFPSRWDVAVGGVLAAGEDFDTAAPRELAEELGVDAPLDALFPIRYPDEHPQVFGMVYRTLHDGPFRLQREEIVDGTFVSPGTLATMMAREKFCPDGLVVLAVYRERFAADSPWAS
jgi:isopentenyldiphosphate isomerase